MNRFVAIALCLLAFVPVTADAQRLKIGYVNLARIEKESPLSVRGMERLKQEFEPRSQQIRDLQKRIAAVQSQLDGERAKLPAAELQSRERELTDMMRQSDQMVFRFSEELEQRRNELRQSLGREVQAAIKVVVANGKYDVILQEAVFVSPGTDITAEVLKAMAK